MFIDISPQILKKYNRPEEYLIDHYPDNYFDYYIDIGTRGIKAPWHIHNIAKNNPRTQCFGYEPDTPYYDELMSVIDKEKISNVTMHPLGLGDGNKIKTPQGLINTVTLSQIFEKYSLDPSKRWALKSDCEGGEYSLLTDESVNILKYADHLAIEFHVSVKNTNYPGNFFTLNNQLPQSYENAKNWLISNFNKSHLILLTSDDVVSRTYVLISLRVVNDKSDLFWDEYELY